MTAIVSPIALPTPSITADNIPDFAAGIVILKIVLIGVAPKARDASLYDMGTYLKEDSDIVITVGKIIIDKIIITANKLSPTERSLNIFLMIGTIKSIPKNPYTTEGIPAKSCINGLMIFEMLLGDISAKNTAVNIPMGTPIMIAPNVPLKEHNIKGKIPYILFDGCQSFPKIKLKKPISNIAGNPHISIYNVIKATKPIDMHEDKKNIISDNFSFEYISAETATFSILNINIRIIRKEKVILIEPLSKSIDDAKSIEPIMVIDKIRKE